MELHDHPRYGLLRKYQQIFDITAMHEAGHAALYLALGYRTVYVSVYKTDSGSMGGDVSTDGESLPLWPSQHAAMTLAGPLAEWLLGQPMTIKDIKRKLFENEEHYVSDFKLLRERHTNAELTKGYKIALFTLRRDWQKVLRIRAAILCQFEGMGRLVSVRVDNLARNGKPTYYVSQTDFVSGGYKEVNR